MKTVKLCSLITLLVLATNAFGMHQSRTISLEQAISNAKNIVTTVLLDAQQGTMSDTEVNQMSESIINELESVLTGEAASNNELTLTHEKTKELIANVLAKYGYNAPEIINSLFVTNSRQPNLTQFDEAIARQLERENNGTEHDGEDEELELAYQLSLEGFGLESGISNNNNNNDNTIQNNNNTTVVLTLHQAAEQGNLDRVKQCIEQEGKSPRDKNGSERNVWYCAAQNGYANILNYLKEWAKQDSNGSCPVCLEEDIAADQFDLASGDCMHFICKGCKEKLGPYTPNLDNLNYIVEPTCPTCRGPLGDTRVHSNNNHNNHNLTLDDLVNYAQYKDLQGVKNCIEAGLDPRKARQNNHTVWFSMFSISNLENQLYIPIADYIIEWAYKQVQQQGCPICYNQDISPDNQSVASWDCLHFICKECKQEMLNSRNTKCPICNIQMQFFNQELANYLPH